MKLYLKTKDYSVSGEKFQLLHNLELDMLVTDPQPENLEKFYQSEDYISHTDSQETFLDKIYQNVKKHSLKKKLKLIGGQTKENKTLLDVGSGTGDFLLVAKNSGWKIDGVEPNEKARKRSKEKGVETFSNLNELSSNKYAVITLWHVLEHLPNLERQITKISSLLEENGTLIVAVPNYKSFDALYYKNFWAAFDVPRHLWHFSKESVKALFQKENMIVTKIRPMVFDSYYVSLLSEKYKTGKQNFIKACFIGLVSNLKAWRTKEYSSLIYIIKKA
ncbi:2-polyprenyl-3-methyl-5-hydroxy-6-metoxy-1,4-benzoquinol methylase [Saonia flava]|uniref:2-polyprenyl-3-methyl-5-hydroxy-6-metoxy-1, 4-benzoquinol methylase n=1 Tax=Saonia flava TaxID=523696 RepID=A0A846QX19_9FLAO|nr:class I SAM-dependent methyltransferase [Saonia flava]NJB71480.1 2-polyprenyl-3-methyl-5-hydroxy-6-metoxy-1,4-benzoquinol methylase [Saonia flava]